VSVHVKTCNKPCGVSSQVLAPHPRAPRTLRGLGAARWDAPRWAAGCLALLLAPGAWAQAAPAPPEAPAAPAPEAPPAPPVEAPAAVTAEPVAAEPAAVDPAAFPADPALDPAAAGDADAAAAAFGQGSGKVEEVIVTADRRRKDLQDYSGTASAFSENKLRAVGIDNVRQLDVVVPGLQIGTQESGTSIYIRGIGSDNNTELGDPAVALHFDGVYMPRPRGLGSVFFDIERVEVNSGPQGTLRGRNAVGGSINIVSKQPVMSTFDANAQATFGTYNLRTYEGMVNIPFGDTLALRVAARTNSMDPTWENAGPINHIPGSQNANDTAFRATLRWKPTTAWDITLGYDYLRENGLGYVGANVIGLLNRMNDGGTPGYTADDTLAPLNANDIDNPRRIYQRGRYPDTDSIHQGVRFNAQFDAGPVLFEALASYRDLDYHQWNGSSVGVVVPEISIANQQADAWGASNQWHTTSQSYIGELRAYAPDSDRLRWTVGIFGFHEDQGAFLGQVRDPVGGFNEFNMPSTVGYSYAGYADATFDVTDQFRVLAGLRYSVEHKDRLNGLWMLTGTQPTGGSQLCAQRDNMGNCTRIGLASDGIGRFGTEGFEYKGFDRPTYRLPDNPTIEDRVNFFFDGIKSFGARDEAAIALCNDPVALYNPDGTLQTNQPRIALNDDGNFRCVNGVRSSLPANLAFTNPVPQNGENDNKYLDFRVGIEYDLSKDSLLYATLTSGHKAGGFNDTIPIASTTPGGQVTYFTPKYGPETAYSLEIGSKNVLADRRLRLNGSAFAFLYDGMQFQTIIAVGDPPPFNADGTIATDTATGMPYIDTRSGSAARQNAQKPTPVYGLDIDGSYSLPFGLEAGLHALFMDAHFVDGTVVNDGRLVLNALPAQVDLGGNWLPRVTPYTINYNLSQILYTEQGKLDWQIQAQTRGLSYQTVFNGNGRRFAKRDETWGIDPITGNPAPIQGDDANAPGYSAQYAQIANNLQRLDDRVLPYTIVNLGAGWEHPEGRLSIRGYVNNVFNTTYANTIISTAGNNIRFYNNQRMAGVRVRVNW
jgi:iron complex outermembrane recepter protein